MARLLRGLLFYVFLTAPPALARRAKLLDTVGLSADSLQGSKMNTIEAVEKTSLHKDRVHLLAGALRNAAEAQGAATKNLAQKIQHGGASFKQLASLNAIKATGDVREDFGLALKLACQAIYMKFKTAAQAEYHKHTDPRSDKARGFKKDADMAAAVLIQAETTLWNKTELLLEEAFGEQVLVKVILQSHQPERGQTVARIFESLHEQVSQFDIGRLGLSTKDIAGYEALMSQLSSLEEQEETMQGKELDSDEIDLTKPALSETKAFYSAIVKMMLDSIGVQLNLLRAITAKRAEFQWKLIKGSRIPKRLKTKLAVDAFLEEIEKVQSP